jgi:hypothetical protein
MKNVVFQFSFSEERVLHSFKELLIQVVSLDLRVKLAGVVVLK